uniref:AAA+ ATPase domain-containing protein n=1 Tax=Oryza glumipatula TaxID=40148 RepID=A0A0E0BSK5_9ORYZ
MWWNPSKDSDHVNSPDGHIHPQHYRLVFHKRHRQLVQDTYLPHIIDKGHELRTNNRKRQLFTNNEPIISMWSHIPWKHPAMFNTLAMDLDKKAEIIQDLTLFKEGRDCHSSVGKVWKRRYLLYGPSGTGKSSMISAMANFLCYDVYDLDLTTVRNNTDLRKLLLETTEQSIIVIEDIHAIEDDLITTRNQLPPYFDRGNKITLSGLLNFVDGLWSACGGERIIVLTTNHVDRLDAALIHRGRMDKHIEMSYCRFEAFKVLASNYLSITEHPLFEEIQQLLNETNTTPADVAHILGKRSRSTDERLAGLVETLKKAKLESGKPRKSPIRRPTSRWPSVRVWTKDASRVPMYIVTTTLEGGGPGRSKRTPTRSIR